MIEKMKDKTLNVHKSAYVHPTAVVRGEVTVSEDCSVWPCACVRGDIAPVTLGARTNIQENASVHVGHGTPAVLGSDVTVGHGAIVHGARIGDGAVIGMGAIVLDGAEVGAFAVVGAGALIPGGKTVPPYSVAVGNPFQIIKTMTPEQAAKNLENAAEYVALKDEYLRAAKEDIVICDNSKGKK